MGVMHKTRVCYKIYNQKAPKAYSDRSEVTSDFIAYVVIKFTDELLRKQQCGGKNSHISTLKNKQLSKINTLSETNSMEQSPP